MDRHYKVGDNWFVEVESVGGEVHHDEVRTITLSVLLNSDYELFTVEEVAEALRLSGVTVRRLAQDNELESIRIGTNYRITRDALKRLKTGEPKASPPGQS